jgi:hypothetical protein
MEEKPMNESGAWAYKDMRFLVLQGANTTMDDDGLVVGHTPRGQVVINIRHIMAFYDNTIIVDGHKIRVMETADEIRKLMRLV